MRNFALACLLAIPGLGMAVTLTTAVANNGSGGNFMTLTATGTDLKITGFATYFASGTVGTVANVEMWVRSGSYAGFTTSNAGWTLHETLTGTAAGTTVLSPVMDLVNDLNISAGQSVSVYLHSTTAGNGIRYTGTGANPPQTDWTDGTLSLFSNISQTGAVPFAGSQFTPRTFAGQINYEPVPEPGTMAVLGFGIAAIARRRRAR